MFDLSSSLEVNFLICLFNPFVFSFLKLKSSLLNLKTNQTLEVYIMIRLEFLLILPRLSEKIHVQPSP